MAASAPIVAPVTETSNPNAPVVGLRIVRFPIWVSAGVVFTEEDNATVATAPAIAVNYYLENTPDEFTVAPGIVYHKNNRRIKASRSGASIIAANAPTNSGDSEEEAE